MARLSSRELALERRKALTTSGKKSSVAAGDGANRIVGYDAYTQSQGSCFVVFEGR